MANAETGKKTPRNFGDRLRGNRLDQMFQYQETGARIAEFRARLVQNFDRREQFSGPRHFPVDGMPRDVVQIERAVIHQMLEPDVFAPTGVLLGSQLEIQFKTPAKLVHPSGKRYSSFSKKS